MHRSLLIGIVLLGLAPMAAHAQSPEEIEAATELLETLRVQEQMEQTMTATMEQQVAANPAMAEISDLITDFARRVTDWDAIKDDVIALYASQYTAEDMRAMARFFSSPIGQRYLDGVVPITSELQAITQKRSEELMPELMEAMRERLGH